MKYRSRVGLYDILIYQAHIPGWVQWFVDTIDNICQLNGLQDFISWIIDVIILPLADAWQRYIGINLLSPIRKIFLSKETNLENEKARFYEEYENNWRGLLAYLLDNISEWFSGLNIIWKVLLAIIMFPLGLAIGFSCIGVYFVFFYGFVVLPLVLFGFVTFFIPMGYAFFGYSYYLQRVETMKKFLSKFQYRDVHAMHRLFMNLLKNSLTHEDYDYDNQVRLIDSLEKQSFSKESLPDLLTSLHVLMITSEDWPIQKHAFLKYKLLLPNNHSIYDEDEAILLFNHTMFHACFEEGLNGNRIGSRRLNLVKSFLTQVFSQQIIRIAFQLIDSDLPMIQSFRNWYQGRSKEEQYYIRTHFCFLYYCHLLTGNKSLNQQRGLMRYVQRWLFAILRWQTCVFTKQYDVKRCYEDVIRRHMNQSIASINSGHSEIDLFAADVVLYNPRFYKPKKVIPDEDEDSDIEKSKSKSNRRMEQTLNVLLQEVAEEKRGETKRGSQDRQSDSKILGSQKRRSIESAHQSSNNSRQGSRIAKLLLPRPYDEEENEVTSSCLSQNQNDENSSHSHLATSSGKKDSKLFGSFNLQRSFTLRLKNSNTTRDDEDEQRDTIQMETFESGRFSSQVANYNKNEEKTVVIEAQEKESDGERTWSGAKNKKDNAPFQIDTTTVDEYITILSTEKNVHALLPSLEKLRRRNNLTSKDCQRLYRPLLQKARQLAWYRDVVIFGTSISLIYAPLIALAFLQRIDLGVALCIVLFVGEILFAQVAPWDDRGFNKGMALRCVASTAYFVLLCWIATFWVLIGVSMFVTCFGIERIVQSFDFMVVNIFRETIASSKAIDKIEQILSKASYALPFVGDYPRNSFFLGIIGSFNSSYSYQDILQGFLVNNNFGAIYLQKDASISLPSSSGSSSQRILNLHESNHRRLLFHWYHGLQKHEFHCQHSHHLLKDIQRLSPSSEGFFGKWTLRYFVNTYFPFIEENVLKFHEMNQLQRKQLQETRRLVEKNVLQQYWKKSCDFLQSCDLFYETNKSSLVSSSAPRGESDHRVSNPLHSHEEKGEEEEHNNQMKYIDI